MELYSATLKDWLQQRNNRSLTALKTSKGEASSPLDPSYRAEVRWHFDQIVKGLHYLHSKKIIHRDIKPANMFVMMSDPPDSSSNVDTDGPCRAFGNLACNRRVCYHRNIIKIGDFGLSKLLEEPHLMTIVEEVTEEKPTYSNDLQKRTCNSGSYLMTGNIGTQLYTAPEVLTGSKKNRCVYNKKADIYGLGVVLFQMLHPCKTEMELVTLIDHFNQNPKANDALPKYLVEFWPLETDLLKRMLSPEPGERPDTWEILLRLAPSSEVIEGLHRANIIDELESQNRELKKEVEELRKRTTSENS